jgi:DNA processing protein
LLRNGATLTENAANVIAQLGPLLRGAPFIPPNRLLPRRELPLMAPPTARNPASIDDDSGLEMILEILSPTPVAVDEVVRQCQLSAAAVATLLLELELAGRIERHPGNLVSRR